MWLLHRQENERWILRTHGWTVRREIVRRTSFGNREPATPRLDSPDKKVTVVGWKKARQNYVQRNEGKKAKHDHGLQQTLNGPWFSQFQSINLRISSFILLLTDYPSIKLSPQKAFILANRVKIGRESILCQYENPHIKAKHKSLHIISTWDHCYLVIV